MRFCSYHLRCFSMLFHILVILHCSACAPRTEQLPQADMHSKTTQASESVSQAMVQHWVVRREKIVLDRLLHGSWIVTHRSYNGGPMKPVGGTCYDFDTDGFSTWDRQGDLSPVRLAGFHCNVASLPMSFDLLRCDERNHRHLIATPGIIRFEKNQLTWAFTSSATYNARGEYPQRPENFLPEKDKTILVLRNYDGALYQGPLPYENPDDPKWIEFELNLDD